MTLYYKAPQLIDVAEEPELVSFWRRQPAAASRQASPVPADDLFVFQDIAPPTPPPVAPARVLGEDLLHIPDSERDGAALLAVCRHKQPPSSQLANMAASL